MVGQEDSQDASTSRGIVLSVANARDESHSRTMTTLGSSSSVVRRELTTTQILTPKQAQHIDEVRRMRGLLAVVVTLSSTSLLFALFMDGDPLATKIFIGCCIAAGLGALAILWAIRDVDNYRPWLGTVLGYCSVVGVSGGFYYFGPLSGVILVVPIGIYFFALNQSFFGALMLQVLFAGIHVVLAVLIMTGAIEDVGLLSGLDLTRLQYVLCEISVQIVFAAAFVMARGLRRAMFRTMEELDCAVRDNAQREALLHEVRQDLRRAGHIGGPGYYSQQTLGSFKLGNVIGRGAMGEVYEAIEAKTGQAVAVKLLTSESLHDPAVVSRFLRELELASALRAENIVRVLEVSDRLDLVPYLAMELLCGESLAERLRREPQMSEDAALSMLRALARGVAAAHDAGVIHRDLKPANVFAHAGHSEKTVWKILDFSISKLAVHGDTLTHGRVLGTPAYMAPEQARGTEVDHRVDLYALGAIAYRALTGRPPFSGIDVPTVLHAVVYDPPRRPSEIANLPRALDRVFATALAKRAESRFGSAQEFVDALEQALRSDDRAT